MSSIRADAFPFGRGRGFKSVEEALASIGTNGRQNRANAEGAVLKGRTVTGYCYGRHEAGLCFSGGLAVRVTVGDDSLYWLVGREDKLRRAEPDQLGRICKVHWTRTALESRWEREALLSTKLGSELTLFDAGDIDIRFYTRGRLILQFKAMRDLDAGDVILYWDEDD